jgi:hypothetical protein
MTRTLLAFGDSHTAGSEIDEKNSPSCFSKAYPSFIVKHYGFEYKNYSQTGGSNDWALVQFNKAIRLSIKNKEKVFVLFNFLEPSRTFFYNEDGETDPIIHCFPGMLDKNYIKKISQNFKDQSKIKYAQYLNFLCNYYIKDHKKIIPLYREYLKNHTIHSLDEKSISQIIYVQRVCQKNDIHFVFHTSCAWYSGHWFTISEKNFFGHDQESYYGQLQLLKGQQYSFWGRATHHPKWKDLQNQQRWSEHYPEEYHKYYAKLLINFIDQKEILKGYI